MVVIIEPKSLSHSSWRSRNTFCLGFWPNLETRTLTQDLKSSGSYHGFDRSLCLSWQIACLDSALILEAGEPNDEDHATGKVRSPQLTFSVCMRDGHCLVESMQQQIHKKTNKQTNNILQIRMGPEELQTNSIISLSLRERSWSQRGKEPPKKSKLNTSEAARPLHSAVQRKVALWKKSKPSTPLGRKFSMPCCELRGIWVLSFTHSSDSEGPPFGHLDPTSPTYLKWPEIFVYVPCNNPLRKKPVMIQTMKSSLNNARSESLPCRVA